MKNIFQSIICNDRQKELLARQIREDRLSHAYIIAGPAGSGKRTFARLIAAALECGHRHDDTYPLPCEKCNSCEKILSKNAVDVVYITRTEGKASILVNQIRELQSEVYVSSTEQQNKIYIIEEAHLMNEQAQNALLKVLEEPPKNVLFLLISENNEALLDTIKSRAQTIFMDPIPNDRMREYLIANSKKAKALESSDPDALSEIIASSGASIGTALSYLDAKAQKKLISQRSEVKKLISLCHARRDKAAMLDHLTSLPQKRDELYELFSLAVLALRDIAVCKRSVSAFPSFYGTREEAEEVAAEFSLSGVFFVLDAFNEARHSLEGSANVTVTLANLFCELQKR